MRKIVLEQLKKISFANLDNFDEKSLTFYIPKYTKPKYDIGKCYLIKLAPELVNNANTIATTNWNNGSFPKNQYYKAYVSNIIGAMVKVDCLAFDYETRQDLSNMWSGWLPIKEITQLATI